MGLSVSWEVVLFFALGMLLLYGAVVLVRQIVEPRIVGRRL